MDHRLKCKTQNYKISRRKHRRRSFWSYVKQRFLDMMQKVWSIKEKFDKLDSNEIEKFCSSKDTVNKMKG